MPDGFTLDDVARRFYEEWCAGQAAVLCDFVSYDALPELEAAAWRCVALLAYELSRVGWSNAVVAG